MEYAKTENTYIIKIEKGEEVIDILTSLCVREGIVNAEFRGIGAVEHLSCGYYALDEKKYYFTEYSQLLEVASLTGNVALKEGKPFVHVHGVFTDTANTAFGGHVASATAGVVVEIFLHAYPTTIERTYDEKIGLFLLSCGNA